MKHTLLAQTLNFRQEATTQQLPNADGNLGSALSTVITAVMAIGVLAAFIYIVMGAFEWITSGGEKGKVESARNKITGAIIGLIVLASVFVIILLVQNFLGVQVFTLGGAATTTTNGGGGGGSRMVPTQF